MAECRECGSTLEDRWKFCRFCGTKITQIVKIEEVTEPIVEEKEEVQVEKQVLDKDLYIKVLSSRALRRKLNQQRKELNAERKSLLEQIQANLVSKDFAATKVSDIKQRTQEVTDDLSKFKDLPEELPVEILLDQIESVNRKLKILDNLKADESISKDGIKREKQKAEELMTVLKGEHSKVAGQIRNWQNDLKTEIDNQRHEFESLTIKRKIEEITEDTFKERKEKLVSDLETKESIYKMLEQFL